MDLSKRASREGDFIFVGHRTMAREAVRDHLEHLTEHLPMDEARRLDAESVYAILHEVHCALLERLIAIGERL